MNPTPGTYILLLQNPSFARAQIGRWRAVEFEAGYYLYVGSAFGPGGVRARVLRHFRTEKKKHWHVDYLRDFMQPYEAWYSFEPQPLEHQWAQSLQKMRGMQPVRGFGCSDCHCVSHLFRSSEAPNLALFQGVCGERVAKWQP